MRADFKYEKTYKQACEQVVKMENEIKENLTKTLPNLLKYFNPINQTTDQNDKNDLETINEDQENYQDEQEEEEQEEEVQNGNELEQEQDYDDDNQEGNFRQKENYAEDDDEEQEQEEEEEDNYEDKRDRNDSFTQGGVGGGGGSEEAEDSTCKIVQPRVNKQTVSQEDEEFMKAFESLVTENIAQRTKETIKMPTVDISVPMLSRKIKLSNQTNNQESSTLNQSHSKLTQLKGLTKQIEQQQPKEQDIIEDKMDNSPIKETTNQKSFNFVLMLKKETKLNIKICKCQ